MVFVVAPRLPRHPGIGGKFIYPSDLLSRSPGRPDRVNASKVGISAISRPTDVCRCDLDATASTPGSYDYIGLVRSVPGWLRDVCASQVSRFAFWRLADVYSLDLEPSASRATPNGSVRTVCGSDG